MIRGKAPRIEAARANVAKFCQILDDLPVNFSFTLTNVSNDYDGCWKKISLDGNTRAWHNGSRVLLNSSFSTIKRQVIEAIEREGWRVEELSFFYKKSKKAPRLIKEKVEELYYKQKKSLRDIAKEYGCTKQWIQLLMQKYGLERRNRQEAQKVAISQGRKRNRREGGHV